MTNHRCDPHLADSEPGPLTLARVFRLVLSLLDDTTGDGGNANVLGPEISNCVNCWAGVAMGAGGMAASLMQSLEAATGQDPRPAIELALAAALDQLATEDGA